MRAHPGLTPNVARTAISLLLLFGGLLSLVGCSPSSPTSDNGRRAPADVAGRKIEAVTTVGMIADIVKNVGGDRVAVTALMGPGVDPHLYRATAGDVDTLGKADIIFYGGLELEGRMTDIFVKMARKGTPTIPVSEKIPENLLREPKEFQGKYDPHIWFDVTLWKLAAETVRDELAKYDPNSAEKYKQNAADYLKKLDELHEYVKTQIATIPKASRVLVTAHDAFGYFGRQYDMEVLGLQGTSTATEPGAKDVQQLAETIATRKIKAIFVESSVPPASLEAVKAAVKSRGWDVAIGGQLFSDAMGQDGTPEGTYIGMVRHNVDTIVKALR
jgi:manganese/zinc/iron transport system substrate-binding protein